MNSLSQPLASTISERVTSVDFFRGFTMFLLVGEAAELYGLFLKMDNPVMQFIGTQLGSPRMARTALLGPDTAFLYVYRRCVHPVCGGQQIKKR